MNEIRQNILGLARRTSVRTWRLRDDIPQTIFPACREAQNLYIRQKQRSGFSVTRQVCYTFESVALLIDQVWIGRLDLLTPYSHTSELQVIQRYRWSTHFTVHSYTRTRILSLHKSYPGNGFITVSLSLQIKREDFFSQPNLQSTNCSTITLIYHLGLYNRPEVAAVPGDVSPTPPKKITLLPLFRNCQFRRLDRIQFLCSRVHILAGWRLETDSTRLNWTLN
jgi:hypothetical protein